jgi:ATP-dependent DNA ligase
VPPPRRDRLSRLSPRLHLQPGSGDPTCPPRPEGLEAWKQVTERGYEGYVAKAEASVYEGGATRRWLKVKQKG